MLFFFRSIFAQIFLNAFVAYRIWKCKDFSKFWKYMLVGVYVAETVMYFTCLVGMRRLPVEVAGWMQQVCGVWVVYQVWVVVVWAVKKGLEGFKGIEGIKRWSGWGIHVFIGIGLFVSYLNFKEPVIRNYDFSFNQNSGDSLVGSYRMLVAADLHLGYIVDKQMLNKHVDLINEQEPDIVVIAGDLIDWDLYPLIKTGMSEDLRRIKATKGVYFVPGNHEYKFNPEEKLEWIAQSGMVVLRDTIVGIDGKLWLIGRDDKDFKEFKDGKEGRKTMDELMDGFDTSQPCIMVAHRPESIKEACEYNIPLTVCGHTHSGQIFPVNLLGKLIYSNSYGWKEVNGCYSYTTSGLGLSGFPLRSGSHCEAVVFNIRIY